MKHTFLPLFASLVMVASCCGGEQTAKDGQRLFVGDDIAVTQTQYGGGSEPRGVSDQMSEALLAFMRTGNPNCKAIPEWPAYNPEDAATMVFDVKSKVLNHPDREALSLMVPFNPWAMMMRPAPAKK